MRTCTRKHLIWMLYVNSSYWIAQTTAAYHLLLRDQQQSLKWQRYSNKTAGLASHRKYLPPILIWLGLEIKFSVLKHGHDCYAQAEHHHLTLYHLPHFSTCRKWLLKTAEHPHLSCATCLFLSLQDLDDFEKCDVASNHNPAGLGICLASLFLQSLVANIIWYCTPCDLSWTLTTKTRTHNTWKSSRIYVLLCGSRFKTQRTYHLTGLGLTAWR